MTSHKNGGLLGDAGEKVTYRLAQRPGGRVIIAYTRPTYKMQAFRRWCDDQCHRPDLLPQ